MLTSKQRAELRDAGRQAAANLPDLSPERCRRIAALLAGPVNEFVKTERHKQADEPKAKRRSTSRGSGAMR